LQQQDYNMKLSRSYNKVKEAFEERILVLDGAMGTQIQGANLSEADYSTNEFENWAIPLKGNHEILNITRPDIIRKVYSDYLQAGADLITTNTFNANRISQKDYGTEDFVNEMNISAAKVAREVVGNEGYVVGTMGPTNRTASLSPDVERPGFRNVYFDELAETYTQQAKALIDGGVDILMLETIFDTLNAKAAIAPACFID